MSAAIVQAQFGNGASVGWANAETSIKFNRDDTQTGTTAPIPVPTATGTNYSWVKHLVLYVTTLGTTTISARTVQWASSPSTGITGNFVGQAVGSYVQAASGTQPTASGSNGAVASGYTALTTSPQSYDATSVSSGSTGPNGMMCNVVLGIDNTYVGGAGTAISVPSLTLSYNEQ